MDPEGVFRITSAFGHRYHGSLHPQRASHGSSTNRLVRRILEIPFLVEAVLFVSLMTAASASAEDPRYIVRFKTARAISSHSEVSALHSDLAGVQPLSALPHDNAVTVRLSESQRRALANNPAVDSIEFDHKIRAFFTPNDPRYSEQYALNGAFGISAQGAWDITRGSTNKLVAIIDSGADYTHEDLQGNAWVNPGEIPDNGVDDDLNGYVDDYHGYDFAGDAGDGFGDSDPMDQNGHGTHVAGIVAATANNGLGVAGVAWESGFIPIKCLDSAGNGSISYLVSALDYVGTLKDQGFPIAVVSMSLGTSEMSHALERAVQRVASRGILIVAAAGNETANNDKEPSYPANFNVSHLISVAATNSSGRLADYSNYGEKTVDLAAPGSGILSTRPPALFEFFGSPYGYDSGTSMATPYVSGVVALVAAANPNASPALIQSLLLATVTPRSALSRKTVAGGIVNAANAVTMAVASQSVHRVLGTIRRGTRGVSGVRVALRTTSGASYRRTTTTNSNGTYSFTNIPSGNYTLTAARTGYLFSPGVVRLSVTVGRRANFRAR